MKRVAIADSALDTERLFGRLRQGDRSAREQLIEHYLPLARRLAGRYRHTSQSQEDLVQVASIGLINAVDRFDPERGFNFAAFAVPTIHGELKRHFRDIAWSVRVPRGLQERALQVERTATAMTASGETPTAEKLAQKLELSLEDVLEAIEARQALDALSMDAPHGSLEGDQATLADSIGVEDEHYELVEDGAVVADALKQISKRDRYILRLRFGEGMTQSQIAERLGVSQMQVSRLLRRTLNELREIAEA
jgi:RNA polymerase sigma-B factor